MDTTTIVFGVILFSLIIIGVFLFGHTPNRPEKQTVKKASKVVPPVEQPKEAVAPAIITTVVDNMKKAPSKVVNQKSNTKPPAVEFRQDVPKPVSKPAHTFDAARVKELSEIFAIPFHVCNTLPNATWEQLDSAMRYIEGVEQEYTKYRLDVGSALATIRAGVAFAEGIVFERKKVGNDTKVQHAQAPAKTTSQTVGKGKESPTPYNGMVRHDNRKGKFRQGDKVR